MGSVPGGTLYPDASQPEASEAVVTVSLVADDRSNNGIGATVSLVEDDESNIGMSVNLVEDDSIDSKELCDSCNKSNRGKASSLPILVAAVIDDDENENRSGQHKSTNTAIDFVPGTLAKVVPHDSHSSSPPTIGSSGRKSTRSSSGYTSNDVSIAPCECYST